MQVFQFGINMLVPIFLCSFVGIFLDKLFNTSFIVIIFFFVGALAGFRNVFLFSKKIYDDPKYKKINYYEIDRENKEEDDKNSSKGK